MSAVTALWEWMPSWILTALNFGQTYPEGDEDDLWALGDAWKKAGADLAALEPDLKSVVDRTQKYYTGDGAEAARKEFEKLFHGEASISENAKALQDLGEYCRNGGTQLEYTKIMEATFAGITVYAVISLLAAWPWGEAGVPFALAAGRTALGQAAEQGTKQLMLEAGKVGLKNLLKPYLKQIGIAGLKMGLEGAGIDSLIQLYQMGAGHRDDFDWKQTMRTGFEWGAGGIVGAPVGMGAGRLLGRTALSPLAKGALTGVIGGVAGGLGMYGAGIGWQAGSQLVSDGHIDWGKIDTTFHPQLIAGGVGLGLIHGVRGGFAMGNAPRASMSEGVHASSGAPSGSTKPHVVTENSMHEGKQLYRQMSREMHPDRYPEGPERERAQEQFKKVSAIGNEANREGNNRFSEEHVKSLQKFKADWDTRAPLGDGSSSHPTSTVHETPRAADSAVRQSDSAARPAATAERSVAQEAPNRSAAVSERGPRVGAERAPLGKESGPTEQGTKAPSRAGAAPVAEKNSNVVAGQKEQAVIAQRGEVGAAEQIVAQPQVAPENPVGAPVRAEGGSGELAEPHVPRQAHSGGVVPVGESVTDKPSVLRPDQAPLPPEQPKPGGRGETSLRTVIPGPPRAGIHGTQSDSPLTAHGEDGVRGDGAVGHRGAAAPVGEFHGEARLGEQDLTAGVLAGEVRNNLALITPENMAWNRDSGNFVLRDGRTVTVRVGAEPRREVAVFHERPDGTGYDIDVSPRARDQDIPRAVAHELAEIELAQDPVISIDPVNERPGVLTDHLGGRFAELRAVTARIDRATYDPATAAELPGLRSDLVDLMDHLGLRDGPQAQRQWELLAAHDPALARRIELVGDNFAEQRPVFGRELDSYIYESGREAHLAQLRTQLAGENAHDVAWAESLALDGRMREELARRVFDPVFEPDAELARSTVSTGRDLLPALDPINEAMNNPRLSAEQRVAAVHAGIDTFRDAMPQEFRDAFGPQRFDRMHAAADQIGGPPRSAGVLDHANGQVELGADRVSFNDFLHSIDRANQGASAHGMNLEYVVVAHRPEAGHAMVEVLSRPRPMYRLPMERNVFGPNNQPVPLVPRLPASEATPTGGHTIDVGVGRSAFAVELTPVADRAGGELIIKTELADDHPIAGQRRRDLGVLDPGPLTEPGTVMVFGDLFSEGKVLSDGPDGGVARIFVNNVSAKLDAAGYDALAASLPEVLAPGGRVEVQWDMKPEKPVENGGVPGDRGHITGPELMAALQRRFGQDNDMFRVVEQRQFEYPGNKDYDYSIDAATSNRADSAKMAQFVPPSPDHRMVIVYEPQGHAARVGEHDAGPVEPHRGTASKVGDFHGDARPVDHPDLLNHRLHEQISRDRALITSEGVVWDEGSGRFRLPDGRDIAVGVGPTRDGAVAEFVERPDGSGYDVNVSPRARDQDVPRAVAHELAEIALEQDPSVLRDAVSDRPQTMTTHLGGRFAELRVLTAEIDRAAADPGRAAELPGLRKDLADLLDRLGLRAGPADTVKPGEVDPWGLLAARDPVLADRVAELGPVARAEVLEAARSEHTDAGPVDTAGVDLSNPETANGEIRRWYNEVTGRIPELDRAWVEQGLPVEQRARLASEVRHGARVGARELMLDQAEVAVLRARDLQVYQNPDGPTFEWLVGKAHSKGLFGDAAYDSIVGSSNRTNAEVNKRFAAQAENPRPENPSPDKAAAAPGRAVPDQPVRSNPSPPEPKSTARPADSTVGRVEPAAERGSEPPVADHSADVVRPPHKAEVDAAYAEDALRQRNTAANPAVLLHPTRPHGASVLPARERATANAEWWHGLDDAHRSALTQRYPKEIGNADGIPAADRNQANRIALERDLQGFRARKPERLGSGQLVNPEFGKGEPQQLETMLRTRDALYRAELLADALHPSVERPQVQLLSYGKGRIEIGFGDADRAASVSLHVVDANVGVRALPADVVFVRNHFESTARQAPDISVAAILSYRHDQPGEARLDGATAADQLRARIAGFTAGREFATTLPDPAVLPKTHVFAYGPSGKTVVEAATGHRLSREVDTLTLADPPRAVRAVDAGRFGIESSKVTFVESGPSGSKLSQWWHRVMPATTPQGAELVHVDPAPGAKAPSLARYLAADPANRAPSSALEVFGGIAAGAPPQRHVTAELPPVGDGSVGFSSPTSEVAPARPNYLGTALPQDHPITAAERHRADDALVKLRDQFGAHADFVHLVRSVPTTDAVGASRARTADNARWWHSLSAEEQSAMVRTRPHLTGNTDGVPFAVRDVANRLSIARDLGTFLERKPAGMELSRWVRDTLSGQERTRLGNLIVTRNHLAAIQRGANEMIGSPEVQLLSYDAAAYSGNGRVSVAIGNADSAANVARHIGGYGTTLRSLAYRANFARAQFEVTSHLAPEDSVAAIVDIGYHHPTRPPEAMTPVYAEVGGYVVARDIAAYNATREFQANLPGGAPVPRLRTAIGHSYGSTTLSNAGVGGRLGPRDGLGGEVDQVVLSGSPGAGPLRNAAEFGLGADNVYTLASHRDPITKLGSPWAGRQGRFLNRGLGTDPTNATWGAVRVTAEPPANPEFRSGMQVHQAYNSFADVEVRQPTEALRNIGLITAGRSAEAVRAEHRPAQPEPTLWQRLGARSVDPEMARVSQDKQAFWAPKVVSERDAAASFGAIEDGTSSPHRHSAEDQVSGVTRQDLDYQRSLAQVLPEATPATQAEAALAHSAFDPHGRVTEPQALLHSEYGDAAVVADTVGRTTANHHWWHGLSPEQQAAVLCAHPHELGNADGIPFHVRDRANRLAIARDLADFRARVPEGVELAQWMAKQLTPGERLELENLLYTHRALERAQQQADSLAEPPPVQVLSYDAKAFGGEGRAVVGFGDADLAESTAWQVPGITTTLQRLSGRLSNSWNLYQVAHQLAPERKLLSVAWLGYDAPSGGTMMTETVSPRPAIEGGRLLARDLWGLHTTRELQSLLPGGAAAPVNRLFAHSFGSTTTAYAASGNRFAGMTDNVEVVLLGSPGMGPLAHASEFNAAQVYVAAGSRDPVTWLGANTPGLLGRFAGRGQGMDPSAWRFGATRISSEFPDLPRFSDALRTHRQYWQYLDPALGTPTEALGNFARIAIGRGDAVDTVAHRPGVDAPTWLNRHVAGRPNDPEAARSAPVDGDFSYRLPLEPVAPVAGPVGPEIQGHRGGRGLWPENTLPAFRNAMRLGIDAIELDVGLTADGVPVVHHEQRIDSNSVRDTAPIFPGDPQFPYVDKPIRELTFEQVRTLDTGVAHAKFAATQTVEPGSTVASLDEVAQLVRETEWPGLLSVEIKTDPTWSDAQVRALIANTVGVLDAREVPYRLLGFDWRVLRMGAELAPDAELVALVSPRTTTQEWLGRDAGVNRISQVRSLTAQVRGVARTPGGDLPAAARESGAHIISPEYTMVTEALLRQAESAGLRVVPWTVNSPADMARLVEMGVAGIVTDFPDRLRAVMAERGFTLPADANDGRRT